MMSVPRGYPSTPKTVARPSSVFASSPTFDFPDGGDFPASPFSSFSSNKDPYRESGGFGFGGGDRDRDSGGSTYFGKREVNTEPRKTQQSSIFPASTGPRPQSRPLSPRTHDPYRKSENIFTQEQQISDIPAVNLRDRDLGDGMATADEDDTRDSAVNDGAVDRRSEGQADTWLTVYGFPSPMLKGNVLQELVRDGAEIVGKEEDRTSHGDPIRNSIHVKFLDATQAERAMKKFNGAVIGDMRIGVMKREDFRDGSVHGFITEQPLNQNQSFRTGDMNWQSEGAAFLQHDTPLAEPSIWRKILEYLFGW